MDKRLTAAERLSAGLERRAGDGAWRHVDDVNVAALHPDVPDELWDLMVSMACDDRSSRRAIDCKELFIAATHKPEAERTVDDWERMVHVLRRVQEVWKTERALVLERLDMLTGAVRAL